MGRRCPCIDRTLPRSTATARTPGVSPQDRRPTQGKFGRWLYDLLTDPRFPPYERQAGAAGKPGHEFVDAFSPTRMMVIEAGGRIWHTRLEAIANDTRRDPAALALGIITIRVGYVELRDDLEGVITRTGRGPSGAIASVDDKSRHPEGARAD